MASFLLSVTLAMINMIAAQQLELPEGASCEGGWVCSKMENCAALGDLRTSRPKICSFSSNNNPILCCPSPSLSYTASKATEMCGRYNTAECGSMFRMNQNNLRPPVQGVIGGYHVQPRMHRHMNAHHFSRHFNYGYGTATRIKKEVVGGYPARPRSQRHMALIGFGDLNSVEWQCGGSIISSNFILSAAHCAETARREIARWARVGDLDISTDTDDASPQVLSIIQRIVHPQYKPPAMYNDIALFRLDRNLDFNEWVGPTCLATQPMLPHTHATVTGWGRTDFAGETSSHLLAVDVSLVDSNECKQLLGNSRRMPTGINADSMICAGEKEGGKDACSGDSGGPLVVNSTTSCLKTQVGIISFGRMCALPNNPGVYTRVYHYIPWIESIVWP